MSALVLQRGTLVLLTISLLLLAMAPLFMPEGYSVVSHSVSESASQGVTGGWIARLGLALMGVAVLALSWLKRDPWGRWATGAHVLFGVGMILTAAFSHAPWDGSEPDILEDTLHSVASFLVGASFIVGVSLLGVRRQRAGAFRSFDAIAVGVAVLVSLTMALTSAPGLVQRVMFLVAFVWYAGEALTLSEPHGPQTDQT